MITGTAADKVAKAIVAGVGTAQTAIATAQLSGHLDWLTLVASLLSGALVGLITWAVPNDTGPVKLLTPTAIADRSPQPSGGTERSPIVQP